MPENAFNERKIGRPVAQQDFDSFDLGLINFFFACRLVVVAEVQSNETN